MFRHLLVPTDGSPLSDEAVNRAVSFAKETGARITFFTAAPDTEASLYGETALLRSFEPKLLQEFSQRSYDILAKAQAVASNARVECSVISTPSDEPFLGIIEAAGRQGCDLILMASHGYRGVKGVLLGSQTQKVLTHSKIPVLVYR